jgi:hypothetical protein
VARTEEERHRRAARVARADYDAITAQRAQMVAAGDVPDLARRLKDMAEQQARLRAAAEEAEQLVAYAQEATAARQREAAVAVASAHRDATLGALALAQAREKAAVARLVEVAGPVLDELVSAVLSRQTISSLVSLDRAPMARQLMQEITAEVARAASQPTPQPAA